jgi:hypothetical protein
MVKKIIAVILISGCLQHAIAQSEVNPVKKEPSTDMYIGVQLNGLIRQVLNFNSSATNTNTNPYLLVYSINSRKTGWGLRLGVGYTYNFFSTNDGITKTDNNINDMQLRLGVEKSFVLSNKWSAGAGLDIVFNNNDDHTTTTVNSSPGFPGTVTDTKTNTTTYGGGPQGWLRYHITERVIVGTEASFYYITGHEKKSIEVSSGGTGGLNQPDEDNIVSQGSFNSPIVLFLIVKI